MGWENFISTKANENLFKQAWRKAQRIRAKVEKLTEGFFKELVTIGIDVGEAPDLGQFTPDWEPLSDSWAARKGHEEFYFNTGALERALLKKNTERTFGRPQIYLDWNGKSVKVNAGVPAKKYQDGPIHNMRIRVIPFPKMESFGEAEELTAGVNEEMLYKLSGPRPLVSVFAAWYVHVKIKQAMRSLTK